MTSAGGGVGNMTTDMSDDEIYSLIMKHLAADGFSEAARALSRACGLPVDMSDDVPSLRELVHLGQRVKRESAEKAATRVDLQISDASGLCRVLCVCVFFPSLLRGAAVGQSPHIRLCFGGISSSPAPRSRAVCCLFLYFFLLFFLWTVVVGFFSCGVKS